MLKWLLALCILSTVFGCSTANDNSYNRALRLEKNGASQTEVLSAYEAALKEVRNDTEKAMVLSSRGRAFFDYRLYKKALDDLNKSSNLQPEHAYTKYMIGLTLGRLGRFDEALTKFNNAINLQSDNAQFYYGKSLALTASGKNAEALEAINEALKLAPNPIRSHYFKGLILSKLNKQEEAIKEFSNTEIRTVIGKDNTQKKIYFDGSKEFERNKDNTKTLNSSYWHYGGRWLPGEVEADYKDS